jgi:hypothetical protein
MVNKQDHNYQVVPYPKLRRALAITLSSARWKPMIHGLLEVDLTEAREILEAHKAESRESLSFTAFIITYLSGKGHRRKQIRAGVSRGQ